MIFIAHRSISRLLSNESSVRHLKNRKSFSCFYPYILIDIKNYTLCIYKICIDYNLSIRKIKFGHGSREASASRKSGLNVLATKKSKNKESHEKEDDHFLLNHNPWDEPVCYWAIKANEWLRRFSSPKSLGMKQWWPMCRMRTMAVRNLMNNSL